MTRFEDVIESVLEREGGYINDPRDPGGETNFGISKRAFPEIDIRNLTREAAIELYRKHYWKPEYKRLSISVAKKVFGMTVNMGAVQSHKIFQRALRACGQLHIIDDGIIGVKTLEASEDTWTHHPFAFVEALRSECAGFYRLLRNHRFEKGWLKRAYDEKG